MYVCMGRLLCSIKKHRLHIRLPFRQVNYLDYCPSPANFFIVQIKNKLGLGSKHLVLKSLTTQLFRCNRKTKDKWQKTTKDK